MIVLYSKKETEAMKASAEVLKEVFKRLQEYIKSGISTKDVDNFVENIICSMSALPSTKNYHGYPAACCTSVNEVVVHGIPGDRVLNDGDIISVDVVAFKNGFHCDACRTFAVGDISEDARRLITVTEESFFKGIEKAVVGGRLGDISSAIQEHVEKAGFSIVRDYNGHGIGREMHEDPSVPNHGKPNRGPRLKPGMVLAVEPMVAFGDYKVRTLSDGWTAVTADGKLAAHYENTVVVTNGEPEILTI